jgi:hypothetical protein
MELEARDPHDRRPLGRASIDPADRPTVVRLGVDGAAGDLFLDWEGALDDAGRLRRCPVCRNANLFRQRSIPAVTPFVIVLAFAGMVLALLGYADDPRVLIGLVAVLVIDIALLLLARTWLVCYRCRSRFRGLPIARQHRKWDAEVASRAENLVEETTVSAGGS